MAIVKSYTDIPQSKKLAKILPLESADMHYFNYGNITKPYVGFDVNETRPEKNNEVYEYIPCWSLAALYHILPNNECISTTLSRGGWEIEQPEYVDKWWCEYENENDHTRDIIITADNPVDACYEMIIRLNELNLL